MSEIWRYDGATACFYELAGAEYREIAHSRSFAPLTTQMLAAALEESKARGQTAALVAFRRRWNESVARE